MRVLSRSLSHFRDRPGRALDIALGVLIILAMISTVAGRTTMRAWLTVTSDAATSLFPLLRVDGAATTWSLTLGLARIGLAILPCVFLIRSVPRRRWLWLIPVVMLLTMVTSPFSLAACATIDRWLLLVCASGVTTVLTRVPLLRWTALLPFALLWEVVPSHGFAEVRTEEAAYRERLFAECARHRGVRPQNLTADRLMPYHGINSIGDDLLLLSGPGPDDGGMHGHTGGRQVGSWWLRRNDGAFQFELASEATGNLWRGCVLDGTIWIARANHIVGVKRLSDGAPPHEEVQRLRLPSSDVDFGETACDPVHGRVYVTEGTLGGLWEIVPGGGEPRRYEVGGIALLPKRRFDGRLVLVNSATLMVFDPQERRVVERIAAGLADFGFDVCPIDGAVAIADMSGRVRVFEMDSAGNYRFAWGISLFAPRRVAYSRDCTRIAVTSADDRRVFMIDGTTHQLVDTFGAGPALREVAPTGPREFSITDSCSMTTYQW